MVLFVLTYFLYPSSFDFLFSLPRGESIIVLTVLPRYASSWLQQSKPKYIRKLKYLIYKVRLFPPKVSLTYLTLVFELLKRFNFDPWTRWILVIFGRLQRSKLNGFNS